MPLVTTARATSANSNTPSRTITRQEVSISRPTISSARASALKDRLSGKPPVAPATPRPARTSSRQEEMSKLQKFQAPQPQSRPAQPPQTTARGVDTDFSAIAPPPSGLAAGQEPVMQSPTSIEAPAKTPEVSGESVSPQYVALARKEQQLRKAQQKLKAEQDAWKQEQAKYLSRDQFNADPLKVLAEAGITPDKLVELQINQATAQDPQQLLLNRIAQLESQLKGITDPETGELAKRDKDAYTAAVSQIRQDAQLVVDSNPSFETIKSEGKTEDVVDLITAVFDDEGIILDVEEAAKLVEDKLSERIYNQYERISKYNKIKARVGKQSENTAEATTEQQPQAPKINTLTNAGATTRPLSARDRAVLLVQERLNAAKGRR